MAVPVAAIAKKAAEVLVSTKSGRKFLGYVIGIAIFLLLLPVIVILGLFGGLSVDNGVAIDESQIIATLSSKQQEEWQYQNEVLQTIAVTFKEQNLPDDIGKAQMIYLSAMLGKEKEVSGFYQKYAECFLDVTDGKTAYDNIESTFGITFSEKDIAYLDELYINKLEESL